jgi:hypothetical protein
MVLKFALSLVIEIVGVEVALSGLVGAAVISSMGSSGKIIAQTIARTKPLVRTSLRLLLRAHRERERERERIKLKPADWLVGGSCF